jgi:DNA-binding NarL/FixJ family response regulator
VTRRQTNRQIAESLFISSKTATFHVSNILNKLGVTNRVATATIAHRLGVAYRNA